MNTSPKSAMGLCSAWVSGPADPQGDRSLNFCTRHKYLRVNAYVIMPTHLHAVLFDVEFNSNRLKHTLDDLCKFTGRQLLDHSAQHLPKSFVEVFRGQAGKDRQRTFWQPTQHPVGIYSETFWKQKMDYLHHNPCRKGLVFHPEDWRFSSALFWATREENDVQLSEVGWEQGDLRSYISACRRPSPISDLGDGRGPRSWTKCAYEFQYPGEARVEIKDKNASQLKVHVVQASHFK